MKKTPEMLAGIELIEKRRKGIVNYSNLMSGKIAG